MWSLGDCWMFLLALIVSMWYYLLGYIIAGPSSKVTELEKEKVVTQIELRSIKSVQLELVRHSKLERKVIKIDKEIEGIKALQEPKIASTRKILRIARVSLFELSWICLYFLM